MDHSNHHAHHDHKPHEDDTIITQTTSSMPTMGHRHHDMHMDMDMGMDIGMDMDMDMDMGHMSMGFTLHTSGPFLLEGLRINTVQGIAVAILLTVVLSLLYEGCNGFLVTHMTLRNSRSSKKSRVFRHLLLTFLKTFSISLSYIIMLAVMTYNVWIMVAAIVGSGISHLFIRPLVYQHLITHRNDNESTRPEVEDVLHDFPPEELNKGENADEPDVKTKLMSHYLKQP